MRCLSRVALTKRRDYSTFLKKVSDFKSPEIAFQETTDQRLKPLSTASDGAQSSTLSQERKLNPAGPHDELRSPRTDSCESVLWGQIPVGPVECMNGMGWTTMWNINQEY